MTRIGKVWHNSRIKSSLRLRKGPNAWYYVWKSSILLGATVVSKISSVACGFSPIEIFFSEYPKSLISRINEVYEFFNKILLYRYFIGKNINFTYNRLFCCNQTCYCVGMVSVTPVSHYVTSASRYQSRSSMYIRSLIPCNWPMQFWLWMTPKCVLWQTVKTQMKWKLPSVQRVKHTYCKVNFR